MRLFAEELLHDLLDLGHAGHAANQHDLVDLARLQAGILQRRLAGVDGALHQVLDERLELRPGQLHRQVLRTRLIGGDEGQVDLGLRGRGQLDLRLLGRLFEALERELVVLQVDALLLLELRGQVLDQAHVEVLATQEGVAIGRLHLEHAVTDLQHGDVESAAAEIVDGDRLAVLLVEAVGQGCGRRLVDDAQHLETGDLAGVLGGLALGVVEIGRNGDHRLLDLLAEIGFRRFLHLLEDHRRDLRRRPLAAARLDPGVSIVALDDLVGDQLLVLLRHRIVIPAADQPLDGEDGVLGIGDRLALGRLADEALPVSREGDDRRCRACTFRILDDLGVLAVHHGDAGIGRSQVDADYFCHVHSLL